MAKEIKDAFQSASGKLQAVVLSGNGKHFCTGADLNWMKASAQLSFEENVSDMRIIKEMYKAIVECPCPIISIVHGKIRGGGLGLVACSDYVYAQEEADFALSEVNLGLIPGIISPFIIHRTGDEKFNELASSGRMFNVDEALKIGLIQETYKNKDLIHIELDKVNNSHLAMKAYFSPHDIVQDYLIKSASKRQSNEFQEKIKKLFT